MSSTIMYVTRARLGVVALASALVFSASSCGGGSEADLSAQAQRGQDLAREKGCAGCHGVDGQGGVGPTWIDLAGSEVELADGSTVVADDAYLVRAILEPGAELVAGFTLRMPSKGLSEAQVADIVAYIKELTSDGAAEGEAGEQP